jgi:WD40 repeat protein
MAQQRAFASPASCLPLQLAEQQLSRRALFRTLAGVALLGGSLLPLTTSCGTTPAAPSSPSQTPTAPHAGTGLSTYRGHTGAVESVAWSPDGKRLAWGSDDTTIQIWVAG